MKYVYILESLDSLHFYVGITDDLRARLAKHNAGEVPHTSRALANAHLLCIQRRGTGVRF
jgi:predicted GIY-YIG superfamily endonuclease